VSIEHQLAATVVDHESSLKERDLTITELNSHIAEITYALRAAETSCNEASVEFDTISRQKSDSIDTLETKLHSVEQAHAAQVQELLAHSTEVSAELTSAQQEVFEAQQMISRVQTEYREEKTALEQSLKTAYQEADQMQKERDAEISALRQQNQSYKTSLESLHDQYNAAQRNFGVSEQERDNQILELRQQISMMEKKEVDSQKDSQERQVELKSRIHALEAALDHERTQSKEVASRSEEVRALKEAEIAELGEALSTQQNQLLVAIAENNAQASNADDQAQALKAKVDHCQGEYEALRSRAEQEVRSCEQEVARLSAQLQTEQEQNTVSLDEQKLRIAALEQQVAEYHQKIEELLREQDSFNKLLLEKDQESKSLQVNAETQQMKYAAEMESRETKITELFSYLSKAEAQCEQLIRERDTIKRLSAEEQSLKEEQISILESRLQHSEETSLTTIGQRDLIIEELSREIARQAERIIQLDHTVLELQQKCDFQEMQDKDKMAAFHQQLEAAQQDKITIIHENDLKIQELMQQRAVEVARTEKLKEQLHDSQNSLSYLKERSEHEITALQSQFRELENDHQITLTERNNEMVTLTGQLSGLQQEYQLLQTQYSDSREAFDCLKRDYSEDISSWEGRLGAASETSESLLRERNSVIEHLRSHSRELEEQLDQLRQRAEAAEYSHITSERALRKELEDLQEQNRIKGQNHDVSIKSRDQTIAQLEDQLKIALERIDQLRYQDHEARKELETVQQRAAEKQSEVNKQLQDLSSSNDLIIQELHTKLNEAYAELKQANTKSESMHAQYVSAQDTITNQRQLLSAQEQDSVQRTQSIQRLESEIAQLKFMMADYEANAQRELDSLYTRLDTSEVELSRLTQDRDSAVSLYQQKETEMSEIYQRIDVYEVEIARLEQQFEAEKANKDGVLSELHEMKAHNRIAILEKDNVKARADELASQLQVYRDIRTQLEAKHAQEVMNKENVWSKERSELRNEIMELNR